VDTVKWKYFLIIAKNLRQLYTATDFLKIWILPIVKQTIFLKNLIGSRLIKYAGVNQFKKIF
jgi:hypothetical protein